MGGAAAALGDATASDREEILAELKALHQLLARRSVSEIDHRDTRDLRLLRDDTDAIHVALGRTKRELAALHMAAVGESGSARMIRQLDAVAENAERATKQILDAAEAIDDSTNTLSASLKHEQELSLALDIQDNVLRIFEACNFQDLSGQRIAKVLATLKFVEQRIAHMVEVWGGIEALKDFAPDAAERGTQLHGPKLDGDEGHASQEDVDAMFALAS
jgi:chemotaxis protein CheZ